jgi:hypothetical protein
MADSYTYEGYKNNENVLWHDGKITPLPPLRITTPYGLSGSWVIEDLEGMVDLSFTPLKNASVSYNFLITDTDYSILSGHYDGMIKDRDGDTMRLSKVLGFAEMICLRV